MATLEEAEAALDLIDELKNMALKIVDKAPYWQFIPDPDRASLDIDGDEAWLFWAESEGGYEGEHHVEWCQVVFPSKLLFLDDAAFGAWKREQAALYEKKRRAEDAARAADAEAKERAVLAALQRKYGLSG